MAVKFVYLTVCVIFCTSLSILFTGNVNAQKELNKDDASRACEDKNDKLMSYSDINASSKSLLNAILTDEQTIWLKDHAIYSPFTNYVGCLNITSVSQFKQNNGIVSRNELFMCLKSCSNAFYAGVMTTKCYCFADHVYLNNKEFAVNDQYCDKSRVGLFNKTYDPQSGKQMTVYKILQLQEVPQSISGTNNTSQCVYERTNNGRSSEYFTGSCSPNLGVKGFLCTRSEYHVLNDTCQNEQPCILTPMENLLKAELICHENSGILLGVRNIQHTLQGEGAYLTGIFRVFQVVPSSPVCLSVRKSSIDGLVIDPGDCSLHRSSFCQKDMRVFELTTKQTDTTTIDKTPGVTIVINKADEEEDIGTRVLIYVGIILSIVCVIVSVPLFILYKHFKATNTPVRSHSVVNSEASAVDLLPKQSEKEYAEVNAVQSIDITEVGTKQTSTPIKPQRKTLRKPPTQSSYENFALGAIAIKENKTYELDNSYDRINMKETARKNNEHAHDEELNIYDHATNDTDEEYDTINRRNKQPANIKAIGDYSTLSEVPCESKPL